MLFLMLFSLRSHRNFFLFVHRTQNDILKAAKEVLLWASSCCSDVLSTSGVAAAPPFSNFETIPGMRTELIFGFYHSFYNRSIWQSLYYTYGTKLMPLSMPSKRRIKS